MAGFYVHIPFCAKKCSYCDFHFSTNFESYREDMVRSISKEIIMRKQESTSPLLSIYFGGGTPSLLSESELSFLLHSINQNYNVDKNAEITIEANPENITKKTLQQWQSLGINRLSIGLQSLKESDLAWMNRGHTAKETISCLDKASAEGFTDISIDLMYGLPNLTIDEWVSHLHSVVSHNITHISAYCLTAENGTKLFRDIKLGRKTLPNDELVSKQYGLLISTLQNNGFEQYEVSNFARNKKYSKHNSAYWNGVNYIGVGPSAHSFRVGHRRWNVSDNRTYIKNVDENTSFYSEEVLHDKDVWNELFLTGLRTRWGVSKQSIATLGGFSKEEKSILNNYLTVGKMKDVDGAFCLTKDGFLFADGIAQDFFRTS